MPEIKKDLIGKRFDKLVVLDSYKNEKDKKILNNEYYEFDNTNQFAREHNLNDKLIRTMANGTKYKNSKYKGWEFGFTNKELK